MEPKIGGAMPNLEGFSKMPPNNFNKPTVNNVDSKKADFQTRKEAFDPKSDASPLPCCKNK